MSKPNLDRVSSVAKLSAALGLGAIDGAALRFKNVFHAVFRDEHGNVLRDASFENMVTDQGANDILDKYLTGNAYTPSFYMGLISDVDFVEFANYDTAAVHSGWKEAGGVNAPTYSGSRKTASWAPAADRAKVLGPDIVFTFTGAGVVKGCFMSTVAAIDSTAGLLITQGLFLEGDQNVAVGNTLTLGYSLGLLA